jgi:diadenosine tetraphosphate (Ap4A) HIT family hydrolase
MRAVEADGFNLLINNGACAGQIVPHVSIQVIPRFPTDGIAMPARCTDYDNSQEKQNILETMRKRLDNG